ncbi:hypothetical protein GCM10010359_28860 [Streptomyces morookaense]|nr:hypothetical protein GCM10010359_28860 [Streptomyces morookaense]
MGTKVRGDLPPGRRRLRETLVTLYGHMDAPTLASAAQQLAEKGYSKDPSEISRYLNGWRLPPANFVLRLYEVAVDQAGVAAVGLTEEELLKVHSDAEPTLCRTCPQLRRKNRDLRGKIRELRDQKAGLEAALASAESQPKILPVHPSGGDRQDFTRDVAAAIHIANRMGDLHQQGDRAAALALLRDTTEVLTPAESAAALVLLRQQEQEQLADTLIHIYGRDQSHANVIRMALALHEYGLPGDAGAILRSATR